MDSIHSDDEPIPIQIHRAQRHHPIHPTVLAEQTEKVFRSAEAAGRFYLKWDLHLPGDLDGWKVVDD